MLLLVGLGNPGAGHARNRHNFGYMVIDEIAKRHGFGSWRRRFQGHTCEGQLTGRRTIALKPSTYMNLSGQSVGSAMRYYRLEPESVIVLHDEIDLAPGRVRTKLGGGSAGHNGLRSLDDHIESNYRRVRLGVGHPGDPDAVADYVLRDFAKADAVWVDAVIDAVAEEIGTLAAADAAGFMNKVSLAIAPLRPGPPDDQP
jgi:PTH1 family peptidyl-tRNA hydrolase